MPPIRVYADTSVYGGVHDPEFDEASRRFFDLVIAGRFTLVASTVVRDELRRAPEDVRDIYERMVPIFDLASPDEAAMALQQAYLSAHIVSHASATDALHVALAAVSDCRLIVSWNFKHIVHFQKIPLYNGINLSRGYPSLGIFTPREVIESHEERF